MATNASNHLQPSQVKSVQALGDYVRRYRKSQGITLETVSGLSNVSTRFLSEFERGKETAEIGKILKVLNALGLEVELRPRQARGKGQAGPSLSAGVTVGESKDTKT